MFILTGCCHSTKQLLPKHFKTVKNSIKLHDDDGFLFMGPLKALEDTVKHRVKLEALNLTLAALVAPWTFTKI